MRHTEGIGLESPLTDVYRERSKGPSCRAENGRCCCPSLYTRAIVNRLTRLDDNGQHDRTVHHIIGKIPGIMRLAITDKAAAWGRLNRFEG